MTETATTLFDRDTAVTPLEDNGAFAATVSEGWSAPRGPNGGYVAAIVLRAMAEVAGPDRPPRSLTLHYLRSPAIAAARVDVTVERTGRTLTTLTARLSQDGRDSVLAVGAFAGAFPSALDYAAEMPDVPPAASIEPVPWHPDQPAISQQFELRGAVGPRPFSGAGEALTGGWLRLREPRRLDAPLLAMYADAWLPAPFTRLETVAPAPTVDLTIHFRAPEAAAQVAAEDSVLAIFRSSTSRDGFFEEDGEIWSSDGVLLAQSRQLALLIPSRRSS